MDSTTKKSIKLTNANQFNALVRCMDEFPQLATGSPVFGSSKAAMDQTWETVAKRVNAHGPPNRTGGEWKKIWADLKSRLKKKISVNNNYLHETGGGPCRVNNLTELENEIDRICHLSTAAAPWGQVFGVSKSTKKVEMYSSKQQNVFEVTPPRGQHNKVAVVTPTSSKTLINTKLGTQQQQNLLALQQKPTITSSIILTPITLTPKQHQKRRVPDSEPARPLTSHRKRKINDFNPEKHENTKLLKQQVQIQNETCEAIKSQATTSKESLEVAKSQAESLKVIAESMKMLTRAVFDVVKHVVEDKNHI